MKKTEKQALQKVAIFSDLLIEELDYLNQIRRNANRKPTEHFNNLMTLLEQTSEKVYESSAISSTTALNDIKNKTITFLRINLKQF